MFKNYLKKFYLKSLNNDFEERIFIKFFQKYINENKSILDVGCGYGRYMKIISKLYPNITGIDVNQKSINDLKRQGFQALSIDEFNKTNTKFDVIILSHIIEHFTPNDLLNFLENYLIHLNNDGYLIIGTPLLSKYFYDDFDHVKPYHPNGFKMIFENKKSQVQYHSKFNLKMIDINFRRSPFKIVFHRSFYIKKSTKYPYLINFLLSLLFKISFGKIGKIDGWCGVFQLN